VSTPSRSVTREAAPRLPPRAAERGTVIAAVRHTMLWVEVTTGLRPRTQVERWQVQDRLVQRLRLTGCEGRPRFYEAPDGRLAFRLRVGWRPGPALLRALQRIDEVAPGQA
jgi:hypothetical protein